jgi:uncharacterized C2H2 Zn-finger protein
MKVRYGMDFIKHINESGRHIKGRAYKRKGI